MKKLTLDEFITRSTKIHKKYDYSKSVYINSHIKIIIGCPIHGDFLITPHNHIDGKNGCPSCGGTKRRNTKEFIKQSKNVHGKRYDYSLSKYINQYTEIKIICPIHGLFLQKPKYHLYGHGCLVCGGSIKSNINEFIKKSRSIHKNTYDYSKSVYKNVHTKVEIICKKHGSFFQHPLHHLRGQGCPICNFSKGESKIHNFLKSNKIKFISQKSFFNCINPKTNQRLKFDFYIPSKNLLIEYDGEQHFKAITSRNYKMTNDDLVNLKYRDKIKTQYACKNGIKLLRIKYTNFNRIDKILEMKLKA